MKKRKRRKNRRRRRQCRPLRTEKLPERKAKLTNSDLEYDSPYNTYKYRGLPPGPIANPGIAAIKAALNPEVTDYYYYALGKEGTHRFFKYYSDFDSFVNSEDYGG